RHTRFSRDWSSDVCSSDLAVIGAMSQQHHHELVAGPQFGGGLLQGRLDLLTPRALAAQALHQFSIAGGGGRSLGHLVAPLRKPEIGRASCREWLCVEVAGW